MSEKKNLRRIKLNTSLGGTIPGPNGEASGSFVHLPGAVVDWDAAEAQKFVDRGLATFEPSAR